MQTLDVLSFQLKNFLKFVLVRLAREEQNILTPHMFTYSHANTFLGQSESAHTFLLFINVVISCAVFFLDFSFFVLNILAD